MKRFLLSILFFVGVCSFGFAQSEGDFRSRATGDWNNSDTWEEFTSGSWTNTANTPTSADGAIQVGNTVTIVADITLDQVTVIGGGTINLNSGVILTLINGSSTDLTLTKGGSRNPSGIINVYGTFISDDDVTISADDPTTFIVHSGGVFDLAHASDAGRIVTADWRTGSRCKISDKASNTSAPNGLAQNFYDFEWDTPLATGSFVFIDLALQPIIGNDLIFSNTGTHVVIISDLTDGTYTIGNDLIVANSLVDLNYNSSLTINVNRNVNISNSSEVRMAYLKNCDLNVTGNFLVEGSSVFDIESFDGNAVGNLTVDGSFIADGGDVVKNGGGTSSITYNGLGSVNFTNTVASSADIDYVFSSSTDYDLVSGALVGAGDFTLGTSANLGISSTDGISSGTSSGAIRVSGTRTYNTGAIIEYNGSSTQALGNGFPSSGVDLTINNTGGGVNMSSDVTIESGRTLTLTEGTLNIGDGNLLTLNGTVTTTNGGISGGSLSDLTIGGTGAFGTLGFAGTNSLNDFTINRTSTGSVTLGGDLTVLGTFTQTDGDLILNGNTLTLDGIYDQVSGTLESSASSSLIVQGAGSLPASLAFNGNIQKIRMNRTGETLELGSSSVVADTLEAYAGILSYNEGPMQVNAGGYVERRSGASFVNPLNAVGSYDLTYRNSAAMTTGPELPTAVGELNNLEKRGAGTLTLGGNTVIGGSLTLTSGLTDASTFNVDLAGDFVSDGNSTLTGSTFTFTSNTVVSGAVNPDFGNIVVNGGAALSLSSSLNVAGDLTNDGTLTASSGTINFNGTTNLLGTNSISVSNLNITTGSNLTANSSANLALTGTFTNNGTFNANNGTIEFNGANSFVGTVPTLANVIIGSAGTLDAPSSLTVSGNFTNNGSFTNNGGVLDLTGTGTRTLGGSSSLALHTLNISGGTVSNTNNAGITIANGITLGGSTTLDADGSGSNQLTLLSTSPTNSAFIGAIPSGSSVTGNVNVQRYFSTGRFYRYLGSPVANTSIADWKEEFPITGTFSDPSTGSYDGTTLNSSKSSLYYWDAGTSVYVAYPTSGSAASNPIEEGRGYTPFIRNSISNITGEVTGVINQGAVQLPVAYDAAPPVEYAGNSWNLVANPYPAPIDWDAAGWTKTNIANEVHVPKTDGSFATYIGGAPANGGSQYIASGQAFWIRATASSPVLEAVESIKSVGQNPQYFRSAPIEDFRIELSHENLSDEIVFVLRDGATFGYDEKTDANRRLNINGFGYTLSTTGEDGRKLKINSIPKVVDSDCSKTIPLNMESVSKKGDFSFSFSNTQNLLNYYSVHLVDNYENKIVPIESDFKYDYVINTDPESKAMERFSLLINNTGVNTLDNLVSMKSCAGSGVNYALDNLSSNINYSIYKGDEMLSEVSGKTEASIAIPENLLVNSVNEFDIYGKAGTCDSVKVGSFTVNATDSNINLDINVSGSSICPKATVGNFELNTEGGVSYFILDENDTIQHISGDGSIYNGTIDKSFLEVGANSFAIAAEKNECAFGTLTQELEIVVDDFEIDQDVVFTSSDACYKNSTFINFGSQSGVDYEIFKGATLVKNISGDGTEKNVEIPSSNLSIGFNEFTVVAKQGDCGEYQFPNTVEINVEENINKNLSLITENTCGDSNSIILIENAQVGKQYSLMKGEESLSSLTATKDGELTFTLNSNQVTTGLNELDIQIDGGNCGTQISANKAIFTVQESINTNLQYIAQNACGSENAVIGVANPQIGKVYKVYKGETLIESKVATEEGDLVFDLVDDDFSVGQNTFNVKIESESCGVKEASQSISLEVYEAINTDLTFSSTNACAGNNVVIEILNPQIGKTYRLTESESVITSQSAESTEALTFSLPANDYEIGSHSLSVDIIDDNCGTVTANESVEFEVFTSAVIENIENQNICLNDEVQVDLVSNVPMSNYQLYVGEDLVQENASSTLSLSPSETTTYTLIGMPESGCDVNSVTFTVEVTDLAKPGILVSGNVLESSIEGDQYQWYLNGELLEEETGKLIVTSKPGDYTVEVSKANCSMLSDSFTFNEEVLNANRALENALNFYPNPVADKLFVELDNINSINITIFTVSGKFMDKFELEASQSEIDMHKFDKGTYLVQFKSGKGSVTKRIVKL